MHGHWGWFWGMHMAWLLFWVICVILVLFLLSQRDGSGVNGEGQEPGTPKSNTLSGRR